MIFRHPIAIVRSWFSGASPITYDDDTGVIGFDGTAIDLAGPIHAAASKTPPVDADEIPLVDSASDPAFGLKKLTWGNLKATLETYFDTVYTLANLGGIAHSLATAANDFLVASGSGVFVKKTLAETKIILGLAPTDGPTFDHLHLTSGQIGFPATQVPSADPNTLDDYEEGTWEGALVAGTSGTITLISTGKTGAYVKIGSRVTVTGWFYVESVSSPVGPLSLTGLPFVCGNNNRYYGAVAIYPAALASAAITAIVGYVGINTSIIYLDKFAAGAIAALAADVQAGSSFRISATYFV